ncbi:stonin 2 [Phyllostomus discolor]|uniref:Stonin 2 n=1 Tax=Phyllostomus discolor TaxID=89673 RepID=A0A834BI20_9CHIR|nr:stonin 2 [Phyllostomus discolor]
MTTLDHVIATQQSEWVSFNEDPLFPVPSEGGTEEHFPGLSSSSDQSESSSAENHVADGGSQDLSHSEQDDSSEKMGLISEAASPPGSPEHPSPDLASAIRNWVQFEDDTPWASTSPPPKVTGQPLTMPCWTCPSFNSLGRCPLTSESSWTTHSEDTSSPSCGPSYTDLQFINAEEQLSGRASGADSTGKTEHHAGGLCKSLLVTCCHHSNLCSQACLKNEFRCK